MLNINKIVIKSSFLFLGSKEFYDDNLTIKENAIEYVRNYPNTEENFECYDSWTRVNNTKKFSSLFYSLCIEIQRAMDNLDDCRLFCTDSGSFVIQIFYDDGSQKQYEFTGNFKDNKLDYIASLLMKMIPETKMYSFILENNNEDNDERVEKCLLSIKAINKSVTKIGDLADVIVNSANESLLGGGGVDGAIHHAAGPMLYKECLKLNGCKPGEAKYTNAYNLPQKYIIHTVGPRYYDCENPAEILKSCYLNCLKLADELGCESIAFSSISTGVFGYPIKEAADICASVVCSFKAKNLKYAYMCCYNNQNHTDIYNNAFSKYQ